MILIFSRQETVIERALQRVLKLLTPEAKFRAVFWSEDGDYPSLQKGLKNYRPLSLLVSIHDSSADHLSQLFQSSMKPAPRSLIIFGPGAEGVVKQRKVLDWVSGKATGE